MNYSIEPRLTLKQPFLPEANLTIINERLRGIEEKTRPFTLVMNGIENFRGASNVAYVTVENKQPVIELHTDIVTALKGFVKQEGTERHELERFIPHVSIGESIPKDVFPTVNKMLSGNKLHLESEISAFTLYSGTWDGI